MEQKPPLAVHTENVASLIFIAERSVSIVQATGEGVDGINAANFGELFTSIHDALVDATILAVAKIFERPTRRYPLWSLPSLLEEIEANADQLVILDRGRALAFLRTQETHTSFSEATPNGVLTRALVDVMRAQLPDPDSTASRTHDLALEALRRQRDKVIAHNEALDRDSLLSASWEELTKLLTLAKEQIGIVGGVFLNTVYMTDDGDYMLSSDAARAGMAMRRLLTKAGLRPARWPGGVV